MGGSIDYVYRDGSRLTPWMLYVINRANAEFKAKFGCELLVTSGIRTNAEQTEIFLSKYRVQWTGNGPYGDVRWWKGRRYVRVVGGGTVAAPSKSNHEIQGTKAAADLRDSGRDAGVSKGNNPRADWLRANAARLGLIASGYGFGEPWHYDIPDIFRTPPSKPAGGNSRPTPIPAVPEEEDEDMKLKGAYYKRGKTTIYLLFNEVSGFYVEHSGVGSDYNNPMAKNWETNSWVEITEAHAKVLKAALDKVRTRTA